MDRIGRLQKKARELTDKPGVYLMKNIQNDIIYIGKAKALKRRVSSYFRKNASHDEKVKKMVSQVQDFDFIVTDTELEALLLENALIKQYRPKYNILLKDDKGYHYILITDEEYPRILAVKQKTKPGVYIGPYASSFAVKQAVEEANRVFLLPTCSRDLSKKSRPCLNYQIKRCSGVCRGRISKEEYRQTVDQAAAYIRRGSNASLKRLQAEMEAASQQMNFEKAMLLRDRIRAIEKISEQQKIYLKSEKDLDVIATAQNEGSVCVAILKFRNGRLMDKDDYLFHSIYSISQLRSDFFIRYYTEHSDYPKTIYLEEPIEDLALLQELIEKQAGHAVRIHFPKKGEGFSLMQMAQSNAAEQLSYAVQKRSREITALSELTRLLGLKQSPARIEAYDISNLKDSGIVGGMVVFENGLPKKSDYKRFKMKDVLSQDDYASMKEMLSRRFRRYFSEQDKKDEGFGVLPDLILIDGGASHIAVISDLLKEWNLSIPCFGMVKDSRHRTRAIAAQGKEISIASYKSAFGLLTRIQDEVHRFTISYQKKVRKKNMLQMKLTQIPGIGEKKSLLLYRRFKTKKALKEASPEEIAATIQVSPEKGREIKEYIQTQL